MSAPFRTLDSLPDVTGKVALVRVDLNLPMADGRATDLTRAEAVAPTILELADAGAKVLLLAHFGRPKGERHSTMSTSVLQGAVEHVLGRKLMYISEVSGPVVEQVNLGPPAEADEERRRAGRQRHAGQRVPPVLAA